MLVPVIAAPGRIELVDEPAPELRPGYVLVDVRACGICGTELAPFRDPGGRAFPIRRLGHEFAGVVAAVGDGVEALRVGDSVVAGMGCCGRCPNCLVGQPNYCERQPRPLFGPAGIADRLVVAAGEVPFVQKIDRSVDPTVAALHEPLNCALRIADRALSGPAPRVAVFGLGPMGLLAALCLRDLHRVPVVALVDVSPERMELARALGFGPVLDGRAPDVVDRVRELADGRGVDVAIEATGSPAVFKRCVEAVRVGGRVVQAGLAHHRLDDFDQAVYVRKEIEVVGAKGTFPSYLPDGRQRSVDVIERGLLPLERLVAVYPFERTQDAFEDMAAGRVFKAVVVPAAASG